MRMPRFRFTVRRMMVVVAIVAILIALKVRRDRFVALAAHYAMKEELTLGTADAVLASDRAKAARRERLRVTYTRAARYPWLPVAPDPPEPQ